MGLYNTNFIMVEAKNETKVNIFAENEYYDKVHVAYFDFYFMEGWYYDIDGKQKEVKRFSAIMNYLFKQNERLCWEQVIVEKAKQNAKKIKSDEKKKYLNELKEADEKKASDMMEGIKQYKAKYTNICKSVENKTDEELYHLVVNTFKHASKRTINEVLNIIKSYNDGSVVYLQNEVTEVDPVIEMNTEATETITMNDNDTPEVFHLNNNTFNTYNEAFNHAVQNQITTTKILSSKHPTMTTKRLQQLECSFVFDKSNMSYEDKKDYFDYLEGIPNSLDRENRYYKLKSWIERYEAQQQRQQKEKDRIHNLGLEASKMLEYMVENGLEIKENESYVKYYFNGQDVHTWFSGISTDKYHEGIMNIYNRYFKVSS